MMINLSRLPSYRIMVAQGRFSLRPHLNIHWQNLILPPAPFLSTSTTPLLNIPRPPPMKQLYSWARQKIVQPHLNHQQSLNCDLCFGTPPSLKELQWQ
jgi:hypothetical protein